MRRGRGKGRKQNVSARKDCGSGEEEKIPAYRGRGRPQKQIKDDFEEVGEEEMVEKIEEDETDDGSVTSKDLKKEKKRKVPNGSNADTNEEENGLGSKSSTTSIGNGSRRKSKPRRAAEAVVKCITEFEKLPCEQFQENRMTCINFKNPSSSSCFCF